MERFVTLVGCEGELEFHRANWVLTIFQKPSGPGAV